MKTTLTLIIIAFASTSVAAPLTFKYYGGTVITLNTCLKSGTTVTCSGNIVNNQQDMQPSFYQDSMRLISPTGDEVTLSSLSIKGTDAIKNYVQLRQGITYPLSVEFKGYSAGIVKYFDVNRADPARVTNFTFANATVSVPQRSVTSPAPIQISNQGYNVTLSNCVAGQNGTFTCAATFTPAK